jgi:hypothetical protein
VPFPLNPGRYPTGAPPVPHLIHYGSFSSPPLSKRSPSSGPGRPVRGDGEDCVEPGGGVWWVAADPSCSRCERRAPAGSPLLHEHPASLGAFGSPGNASPVPFRSRGPASASVPPGDAIRNSTRPTWGLSGGARCRSSPCRRGTRPTGVSPPLPVGVRGDGGPSPGPH